MDELLIDSEEPDILQRLQAEEEREVMTREIALLPGKYRSVILLFYIEGYSYADIVSVLDIPLASVKTNLFRGRNLLRERLLRRMGKEVNLA